MFVTCNRRSLGIIAKNSKNKPALQKQRDDHQSYLWFNSSLHRDQSLSSLLERAVRACAFILNTQTSGGRLEIILTGRLKVKQKRNNIQMV